MYKSILKNLGPSIYKNENDSHPLKNGTPHFIFSVENPNFEKQHDMGHQDTINELKSKGFKVHSLRGVYGGSKEPSMLVENVTPHQVKMLMDFAKKSGQESAIYSDGKGNHEMHYLNGDKDGQHIKGFGTSFPATSPDDNFSTMESDGTMFQHSFDWDNTYPSDRSMLRHHFRREKLEKNEYNKSFYIPVALNKSEQTNREEFLIHYSPKQNLTEISPDFHGERKIGLEAKRAPPENKLSFFYREGAKPESLVTTGALSKYITKLEKHHRLYDIGEDSKNIKGTLKDKFSKRSVNPGVYTNEDLHEELKNQGYDGFFNSKSGLPDVVAMFNPMAVRSEQEMHSNDFKIASARNHTEYENDLEESQNSDHDPNFLANLAEAMKNV